MRRLLPAAIILFVILTVFLHKALPVVKTMAKPTQTTIATRTMSLEDRYPNPWVNNVFKDNILLTIAYMQHAAKPTSFDDKKPFTYEFTLKPNQTFAFHDDVLAQFQGKITKTTNAHFNAQEGFFSDGYLYGDGVCHLASLMYWVAKDANLDAVAPTNHDFHVIPDVPKQYGVAIYNMPGESGASSMQNLYVTNTKGKPLTFALILMGKTSLLRYSPRRNLQ